MATHKEIRTRKQDAIKFAFDVVRSRGKVRLNDLHAFFGDVWKYQLTFIQEVLKAELPNDITLTVKRKVGTIAEYTPNKVTKITVKAVRQVAGGGFKRGNKPGTMRGRNMSIKAKRLQLSAN
jgi:hypothetical protein